MLAAILDHHRAQKETLACGMATLNGTNEMVPSSTGLSAQGTQHITELLRDQAAKEVSANREIRRLTAETQVRLP